MKLITSEFVIQTDTCQLEYLEFEETDRIKWKKIFDEWKSLKLAMRDYRAREPNFPEGLSEVAFCLWSGSVRKVKCSGPHGSFDTFNIQKKRMEQVKACSVERDLTSFGPNSVWDDLFFMDFWNDGDVNGLFDVYRVPNELIYSYKVNRNQSFRQQQAQGRRPRFSLKELISEKKIKPVGSTVKVWH
mgnify:CR=1 FL=1